jgi:hypothetical protein
VQLSAYGKQWHLGCFGFDDHTKAVAAYSRHTSMTKTELEALDKERAKERKEERKRVKEEKKAALALAALEVPTNKGVCWDRSHSCWKVQLCAHGKTWHLGCFGFDDHTKAVAAYSRHTSMTKTELEALDKRR